MSKKSAFKKILGIKLTKRNIIIVSVAAVILFTAIGLGLGLKKRDKPSDNTTTTLPTTTTTQPTTTSTQPTTTSTQPTTTSTQATTTSTQPTTTTTQAEEKGLSTGAIVGIVVACIVVVFGGYHLYWHIKCDKEPKNMAINNMPKCIDKEYSSSNS